MPIVLVEQSDHHYLLAGGLSSPPVGGGALRNVPINTFAVHGVVKVGIVVHGGLLCAERSASSAQCRSVRRPLRLSRCVPSSSFVDLLLSGEVLLRPGMFILLLQLLTIRLGIVKAVKSSIVTTV
jgi:hypothetical protein